ncbi:MAG TPA: hypothetical protein VIA06_21615 [Candidatus Dormibacteraeota bacterium]|nr:hypothetical protein [Candidatus Dormibacteraeota bacterium]
MSVREARAGVAELLTQLGAAGVDTDEAGRGLERHRKTIYVAEDDAGTADEGEVPWASSHRSRGEGAGGSAAKELT